MPANVKPPQPPHTRRLYDSDEYFTPKYVFEYLLQRFRDGPVADKVVLWEPFDVEDKGEFSGCMKELLPEWEYSLVGWDHRSGLLEDMRKQGKRLVMVTNPPYKDGMKSKIMQWCRESDVSFWLLLPATIPGTDYCMEHLMASQSSTLAYLPQVNFKYMGPTDGSSSKFDKAPFRAMWVQMCFNYRDGYCYLNSLFGDGRHTAEAWLGCISESKRKYEEKMERARKRRKAVEAADRGMLTMADVDQAKREAKAKRVDWEERGGRVGVWEQVSPPPVPPIGVDELAGVLQAIGEERMKSLRGKTEADLTKVMLEVAQEIADKQKRGEWPPPPPADGSFVKRMVEDYLKEPM
eukprot:CAMPEP_0113892094 /NCGR_PEP_ID=MMETSP0780_2-20120614/15191_1 /TAXON_ID=652834 /ORGANISM="Palpitomonas bilix" /LENGTH=349 /DNA_ID=CAMNT_0000881925 /DNA_START=349 /DNA_END=1398 /DNA_ORIENTATION=+ /assembly_acc=CAM_ASM_000599